MRENTHICSNRSLDEATNPLAIEWQLARGDSRTAQRGYAEHRALRASMVFRSFAEATIAPDVPDGTGNTHPIMIRSDAELPVLAFQALIERTRTETLVALLRIKLGFPREVFERAVSPVIEGYVEFVQLLPKSESHHHANPGGLFTRALEVGSRALDYRRGQILPRGAAPEVIGAQAHRWTYAVFVAALLYDVGKTMAELRVLIRAGRGAPEPWDPPAGSMRSHGAVSYRVEFMENEAQQDELHGRLPVQLLNRFVPPLVLGWLAADPDLMRELLAFLSRDNSARTGAISELVLRAATESGSRDLLLHGRGDPTVQEAAPAANPRDLRAEAGVADLATTLDNTVGVQPDTTTAATGQSTLPDEETEYLEDVDEEHRGPVQKSQMADPGLAQAPDAARRFIGWLQQGLSDGTLRVNEAGAFVHFVDEGMLLVSPRIFREFAKRFGEDGSGCGPTIAAHEPDIGKSIQRQVLRAGWHLRADKGVNILTYQVMRGDRAVSRLSGVVIRNPARFVNPVPPINPLLARMPPKPGDA